MFVNEVMTFSFNAGLFRDRMCAFLKDREHYRKGYKQYETASKRWHLLLLFEGRHLLFFHF